MTLRPRISILLKALVQLGPRPLALYGAYRLGLASGHYKRIETRSLEFTRRFSSLKAIHTLPLQKELSGVLGLKGRAALLREADEVVRGRVHLFGGGAVPLRLSFPEPLGHWTDYETGRLPLPASAKSLPADPKFLWEPARFGWAFVLGRAFHLTADPKYAAAFWKHFEAFDRGNPPYLGPQWMNGQEVAIRLLALVWSAQVFSAAPSSTPARLERLARSVAEHAVRIPPTLVYARSQNNNHLITEAAALYTAGTALSHAPWQHLGRRWLEYALVRQINSYGEYIQHSTNYHRLMLQAVLWVDAMMRARGEIWPASLRQALARASHWLYSMLDPLSGKSPNLGANDGSLILPFTAGAFSDFRPTVQAAARAFLRTSLPPGPWDELSLWLGLPGGSHTSGSAAYAAEHLRGRDSWAYLRASAFKSRLSHMDQLHFDLWWRGTNIAQDPGTYLYNAPAPWDNALVSTHFHNTVTVDGRDQMSRGGRFLTLDWFPAFSSPVLTAEPHVTGSMQAHHSGYWRLGVRHERTASVRDDGRWLVRDDLIFRRAGRRLLRLHWLLTDGDWRLDQRADEVRLRVHLPVGWVTLSVTAATPSASPLEVTLARAGKRLRGGGRVAPQDGWSSPTYGARLPALSLSVEASADSTFTFLSEFSFPHIRLGGRKTSTRKRAKM